MDGKSMDRIIGDFLEINSDILTTQLQSKYPKFISKFLADRQRKRLINTVEKLRNSQYILSWKNLNEYFNYLISMYPPYGTYQSIVEITSHALEIEDVIDFNVRFICEEYKGSIVFLNVNTYDPDHVFFNLISSKVAGDGSNSSINVYLSELKAKTPNCIDMISAINTCLRNDICDFIINMIEPYTKKREDKHGYSKMVQESVSFETGFDIDDE